MSADLDLARRAVACRGWCWMPGMLVWGGDRVTEDTLGIAHGVVPDLTDPATRGCLLELTKEARNAPFGYVTCGRYRYADRDYAPDVWETDWVYWDTPEGPAFKSGSYEAALVAALEAAPEQK